MVSSAKPLRLVFLGLPLRLFFLVFGDEGSSSCSLKLSSRSAAQKQTNALALHGSTLTISSSSGGLQKLCFFTSMKWPLEGRMPGLWSTQQGSSQCFK